MFINKGRDWYFDLLEHVEWTTALSKASLQIMGKSLTIKTCTEPCRGFYIMTY